MKPTSTRTLMAATLLPLCAIALPLQANYQGETPLKNTLNDAKDMAAKLGALGFEVTRLEDLDRRKLAHGVNAFLRKVQGSDAVALF